MIIDCFQNKNLENSQMSCLVTAVLEFTECFSTNVAQCYAALAVCSGHWQCGECFARLPSSPHCSIVYLKLQTKGREDFTITKKWLNSPSL